MLAAILLGSVLLVRAGGSLTRMRSYADLAFMGAAFLLLETKSIVGFALLAAAILLLCARGLMHLTPAARSPVILLQLLAVPVAFSLGFQAGRLLIAGPILLCSVAVLVLLLTPSARRALDRTL